MPRTESDPRDIAWLRRLRVVGIALPTGCIVLAQLAHPFWLRPSWPAYVGPLVTAGASIAVCAFGVTMFFLIDRGYRAHSERLLELERQHAVLAERDRIAREMHDSLAQVLGVTHLKIRSLDANPALSTEPAVRAELAGIADLCADAYTDVREAILGLRESAAPPRDLMESLEVYAAKFTRSSGIETTVVRDADPPPALTPGAEVQLLRIVQEALTNVRKHAAASAATLTVGATPDAVTVTIADDGIGFDHAAVSAGRERYGLHTMRERADLAGGRLSVSSEAGRGTRVTAVLPAASPEAPRGHRQRSGAAA